MKAEDEYRLSFYHDIGALDTSHNVRLVRHTESGKIYVKKELSDYDISVFRMLYENHYDGIPEIIDYAEDSDAHRLIVIEEFISGRTLRNILNVKGTLPEDQVISVLKAICETLDPLHTHNPPIIHRDIKPENILITDNSVLYLVDFDASKSYTEGKRRDTELIGTRKYAAPEQYGFSQSDPRTDIYAVGRIGFEMLLGDPDIKPEGKSSPIYRILRKCVDMDPDDRFSSVDELRTALIMIDKPEFFSRFSRYTLPGFRTHTMWKMILASAVYTAIIGTVFYINLHYEMSIKEHILSSIGFFIDMMALILFYCNYLGCHSHIPLMRSKKGLIRTIGYVLYTYLIVFIVAAVMAILGLQS